MTDRRFINHQNLNDQGKLVEVDCRFCHHLQKFDKYAHVAPCGCAGGTRYVHRQCLEKWMVVKFQHVYNHTNNGDPEQFNVFCQVCQQRMEMEFTLRNKFSKYQDFVEKIIGKKILFSTLLLLATALLVAIIVLSISVSNEVITIPPKFIFGLALCCIAFVIVGVVFIWNFMIVKSIVVEHVGNHKNPQIMGLGGNMDSIQQEEIQKDPYFGVQETKKDPGMDKSLMLQSKRDSGEVASSVVSKTLTDYVMQKMYRHDEPSHKGRSQKEFNESRVNKTSKYSKKQTVKEMKDQSVQINNVMTKDQQIQYTKIQKDNKSVQKSINRVNQQIQLSYNLKDQSLQSKKDISIQPSFMPRMKRIFREDTSVLPPSTVNEENIRKTPIIPKPFLKKFTSDYQQKNIYFAREYQKPTAKQIQILSNGNSKKSEQQFLKEIEKTKKQAAPQSKLKLKTSKDPIKIKVLF